MVAPVVNMPNTVKAWPQSGRPTQLFTQHSAECPLAPGYARSLTNWSNTSTAQASWHSFVGPDERVRQVPWNLGAWTQGVANQYAIGMECAGYAAYTKAQWLTDLGRAQLENLAHEWTYYWRIEKSLGNEIELRWLDTAEVRAVINGNRSISGFCTHGQIEPATRWDPGPNFPFVELMNRIKQLVGAAPAVPAKPPAPKELFTVGQYEEIMSQFSDVKAILIDEFSTDGWKTKKPGIWPVIAETQRRVDDVPGKVLNHPIRRGGKNVSKIQDDADGTTYALRAAATTDSLLRLVTAEKDISAEEVRKIVDEELEKYLGPAPDFTQEPVVFPITDPEDKP